MIERDEFVRQSAAQDSRGRCGIGVTDEENRVLRFLKEPLGAEQEARDDWYRHWIREGFAALEALAAPGAGAFLFGDMPGLADICLVPQMYNARRFAVPLEDYPTLLRADASAAALEAFAAAHPDRVAPAPAA